MSPLTHNQNRGDQAEYDAETDHKSKSKDLEPGSPHAESYEPGPADPYSTHTEDGKPVITADELRIAGVKRIEAISAQLGPKSRGFVFFGCFLLAYGYGLDGSIRSNYQSIATGSYGEHSLLTTVNVIRSVVGAVGQPTAAKIADVFGRLELLLVSILFYAVGTIVEATASGDGFLEAYAAGTVLYQIGLTMSILLVEVMIADMSSLRTRLFFSFIPAMPFLINTWVSAEVFSALLEVADWRWGIGMWAIIYPFSCLVLITVLSYAQFKARRAGALADYRSPFQTQGLKVFVTLFWQLDVIGILLMIIAFGFFLTPFTLAGGASASWGEAKIIAPLVIGFLFFPIFVWWELKTRYPLLPFHLLTDRGVWAGFGIACTLNTAWYMQGAYLFPVLQIAFGQSNLSATRIGSVFSFTSTLTGIILGLIVLRVRRLKAFIVFGCCLFIVGFGLLIRYRTGTNPSDISGLIGGEIVIGIAVGMFSYPTQASVQARTKHEHVAVITGLYLASYSIGSALGNAISGAVWSNRMPIELARSVTDQALAASTYANPYGVLPLYPFGTPERMQIVEAYGNVQRLLATIGICLCLPLVAFSLLLRDPTLTSDQSLANAETEELRKEEKARGWFSWR